jgi:hypothetical protein
MRKHLPRKRGGEFNFSIDFFNENIEKYIGTQGVYDLTLREQSCRKMTSSVH